MVESFLVRNLFYNDTFVDVLLRGLDGDRKTSRCLPNTSTFVPNDLSQCLYCVLPIVQFAFGAHLNVGLAERRFPCRFVGNPLFPSLFLGEHGRLLDQEYTKSLKRVVAMNGGVRVSG